MKKLIVAILAAALVAGILPACAKSGTTTAGSKPITACIGQEPDSLDPAINQTLDGGTYINYAFEGLTKLDKNGNYVAGIAQTLPKVSADGLTYTYTIRSDAKWSDGKPVTAQDFVYAWQRALNPTTASAYAYQLFYIKNAEEVNSQFLGSDGQPAKAKWDASKKAFVKDSKGNYIADPNGKYVEANADGSPIWMNDLGVKAVDDHTLVVTLGAPCAYFNDITGFATLFPVRKDIVEANPTKWATDPKTYIGDGPYVMSSWTHNSEIVYKKNPNYYDSKDIVANEVDFRLMSDNSAALAAFKNGSLDAVQSMVDTTELPALIKSGDAKIFPMLGNVYVTLNNDKAPFNNEKVREALSLSIDRQYITDSIMKGGQEPAGAFVPTGMQDATAGSDFRKVGGNYLDPSSKAFQANLTKAKQLLAEAGYPGGKGFPTVTYKYNVSQYNQAVAEYLANAWKQNLGINVQLVSEDFSVLVTDRNGGNYDMARDAWVADYSDPMTFVDLATSKSGNNDSKFNNPQFDSLIKDANNSSDETVRMKDMHQAEDLLMKDNSVIPIAFQTNAMLVNKKLQGLSCSNLGYVYLMWASMK